MSQINELKKTFLDDSMWVILQKLQGGRYLCLESAAHARIYERAPRGSPPPFGTCVHFQLGACVYGHNLFVEEQGAKNWMVNALSECTQATHVSAHGKDTLATNIRSALEIYLTPLERYHKGACRNSALDVQAASLRQLQASHPSQKQPRGCLCTKEELAPTRSLAGQSCTLHDDVTHPSVSLQHQILRTPHPRMQKLRDKRRGAAAIRQAGACITACIEVRNRNDSCYIRDEHLLSRQPLGWHVNVSRMHPEGCEQGVHQKGLQTRSAPGAVKARYAPGGVQTRNAPGAVKARNAPVGVQARNAPIRVQTRNAAGGVQTRSAPGGVRLVSKEAKK
eukprot:1137068-Pelagomonas_calceolata.AAC.2